MVREVWRKYYGFRRDGAQHRIDSGSKIKSMTSTELDADAKMTRTEFIKRRRHAAQTLECSASTEEERQKIDQIASAEMPGWNAKHEKEYNFQRGKRRFRECEEVIAGHFLDEGVDAQLAADAAAQHDHQRKLAAAAIRKATLQEEKLKPPLSLNIRGCHIYVVDGYVRSQELLAKFKALDCTEVLDMKKANIVVANNVTNVPELVGLTVKLKGGVLAIPEVILGLWLGPRLAFKPAISVKREVWVSDRFSASNRMISERIKSIAMGDDSSWSLLESPEKFELAKKEARKARRPASVLAVATAQEVKTIRSNLPQIGQHVFELDGFARFVT